MIDLSKYDCTYCGQMASDRDHVIPQSYAYASRKMSSWTKHEVVPACSECNGLLSNLWIPTIAGRAAYIAGKLTTRYSEILAMPNWTDRELKKLGYVLQMSVQGGKTRQELLRTRIAKAIAVSQMNLVPKDVWDVERETREIIQAKAKIEKSSIKKAAAQRELDQEMARIAKAFDSSKVQGTQIIYALINSDKAYLCAHPRESFKFKVNLKNIARRTMAGAHFKILLGSNNNRAAREYVKARKEAGMFVIGLNVLNFTSMDKIT